MVYINAPDKEMSARYDTMRKAPSTFTHELALGIIKCPTRVLFAPATYYAVCV